MADIDQVLLTATSDMTRGDELSDSLRVFKLTILVQQSQYSRMATNCLRPITRLFQVHEIADYLAACGAANRG
jgi:hypothetical protein